MDYGTDPHDYLDEEILEYESDFRDIQNEKKYGMKRRGRYTMITKDLISHLMFVLEGSHLIVFWLDNDSVGENICFQILNMIKREKVECRSENVLRATFSSLAPLDILKCFDQLKLRPDFAKSQGCVARQEIDLRVGLAFTSFLTYQLK